jgi:amidase
MQKRGLLLGFVLVLAACGAEQPDFSEASIAELHDRMQRGELRSEELVHWYLDRIEELDVGGPGLNSIIELNPDALLIARSLDEEWRSSGPRGPLHGIPVVLKANIDTADRMHTTAGSLALAAHIPPRDAFLVSQLRDAGAVILAKANLSEWANFRSSRSSSGWSSIGGQTKNPYDTLRNPCGSSSGSAVAVAANLAMAAIGTETDGSIVCPSGTNGIVGIKPTLGLVSRAGIIPIAHSQDTAGPMARSMRDAAILLSAIAGPDPDDPDSATAPSSAPNYAANLTADGLHGKRIGIHREYYGAGSNRGVSELFEDSIEALREQGAEIVDDIELDISGVGDAEYTVLLYEFKHDLAAYFEHSEAPFADLAEIIEFNEQNRDTVMPIFGQEVMLESERSGSLDDDIYVQALATSRGTSQRVLREAFESHELDAIVTMTNGPAWMTDHANGDSFHIGSARWAAVSGYPNITVPAGFVSGLPIGMSFIGRPYSEQELIRIAYAFEQATLARRAPTGMTSVTK